MRLTEDFKSNRDKFMLYLTKKGIGSGIYYPEPLHLVNHIKKLGYKKGDFPVAEKMSGQVLSLPVHPLLTKKQIDYIIDQIQNYLILR